MPVSLGADNITTCDPSEFLSGCVSRGSKGYHLTVTCITKRAKWKYLKRLAELHDDDDGSKKNI